MSEGWNIALLGATGIVGTALLEIMQKRQFPFWELYLLSSECSAGKKIRVNGQNLQVIEAAQFDWSQAQLAFFVAGPHASAIYAADATAAGCLVIDGSGLFALESDVPLVVPGVNDDMLADYRQRNIMAVADSLTSQLLLAVKPLMDLSGLKYLHVSNMLSASTHGKAAVNDLAGQSARLLNGLPTKPGPRQLAFNLLPLLPDETGSVCSERRLVDEVRKILRDERLPISVNSVQTPVFYGHTQIVHLETLRPMAAEEARNVLSTRKGIILSADHVYPTPIKDISGRVELSIGCLRNDYGMPDLLQFWSVTDNVCFGGALMLLLTAEKMMIEARW
ncbi:MAG: putative semialdehyde dehydrogenase Usg [Sodalis sp. Fse]|nr:MAG: putative semialdehyde dehydrogenase Usg [Sodalis sp. Fse]